MNFRTDLAVEATENYINIDGIKISEKKYGKSIVTKTSINSQEASEKVGKPKGNYITVTVPPLTDYFQSSDYRIKIIATQLKDLVPKEGMVLVVGLGNTEITPDALGPKSVDNVLATRHISGEIAKSIGLDSIRPVSVLKPGVLGKTGMDVSEILLSIIKELRPACVIIIDALASRKLSRLGCTVQISDSGISPGAGVGNARPLLNKKTLGISVVSLGVPTVVDALTLVNDIMEDSNIQMYEKIKGRLNPRGEQMIVTPKEIDLLIDRAAFLIGMAVNCALQPGVSPEELQSLVS